MDRKRIKVLSKYQKKLKIKFKKIGLFHQSLLHSSYVNENGYEKEDNERLEFLGDAVLALIIIEYLLKNYPNKNEGELSKVKSIVVSEETLSRLALSIEVGKYICLGKGEKSSGGNERPAILADTMEAIMGAYYIDSGIKKASKFIIDLFKDEIHKTATNQYQPDYKSKLQQTIQQKYKKCPLYETVKEEGPDHNKTFYVNVKIEDNVWGTGIGNNKKSAQQNAAQHALKRFSSKKKESN